MRQVQLRTLATRGIEVLNSLRIKGLKVFEAVDEQGSKLLIFCGGAIGPNWVSIGFVLEQHGIKHDLLTLGRTYFLAKDSLELRKLLGQIQDASKASARQEVFIQDVGFLASDLQKKFDPRVLIAPALIFGATIALSLLQFSSPKIELADAELEPQITCALDLTAAEFRTWLKEQFSSSESKSGQLVVQTDLGTVSLTVEQTLGSTQLINGNLDCLDGRSQRLQFRTDSQKEGDLVELGERLDP
jgi:hypothetical protein